MSIHRARGQAELELEVYRVQHVTDLLADFFGQVTVVTVVSAQEFRCECEFVDGDQQQACTGGLVIDSMMRACSCQFTCVSQLYVGNRAHVPRLRGQPGRSGV